MKTRILALLIIALLPGCAITPDQLSTAEQIAGIALNAAAARFGVSPESQKAIRTAVADLSGVAAQSQAHLGKTPTRAAVAQGAGNPSVGAAVQKALPDAPLSQKTVDQVFQAAALLEQP